MPLKFEAYLSQLVDPASTLAAADLRSLSSLTAAQLKVLAETWPRISLPRRRQLVQMMTDLAEDNVELDYNGIYKIAIGDTDDEVRRLAVEGLWEDEELNTADTLVRMLRNDPTPSVRAAAATSLSHFVYQIELEELDLATGERIKQALFETWDDTAEPIEVRRRALESMGFLELERVRQAISQAYADQSLKMRVSAVFAMGRSCETRWMPVVLKELQSSRSELRFEAARAAGEIEDSKAVPILVTLLEDEDPEVRMEAADALGKIGGPAAKQALQRAANGADPELATVAEDALEELTLFEDPLKLHVTERSDN